MADVPSRECTLNFPGNGNDGNFTPMFRAIQEYNQVCICPQPPPPFCFLPPFLPLWQNVHYESPRITISSLESKPAKKSLITSNRFLQDR